MKAAVALALWLLLAGGAVAQDETPQGDAQPAPVVNGWMRDAKGFWRKLEPGSGYRIAYMRRGCRVEESWDGARYSASVTCLPGIRPN